MTLPKLEVTRYTTELPVSKKKVEYRPFLVKEQKVLLIALEGEETEQATTSMIDLLNNCVLNRDEVGKLQNLPVIDLEYLFIQVRIKSVGETVDVAMPCKNCEEKTQVIVDLSKASITSKILDPKIELTDSIGMTLSYPTMAATEKGIEGKNDVTMIFDMIYNSIENVYSGDEVFTKDDLSRKELEEFLDQFTTSQFEKVQKYYENMPKFSKKINFVCSKCETNNEQELVGIMDFFG